MGLIAKETGNGPSTPPIPPGMYQAVCVGIYDLGTQLSEKWKKMQHKVCIEWEVQEERVEIDGKSLPRSIRKQYTLSLGDKANLRGDLEAWRGRPFTAGELEGFDLFNIIGVNCYLNMIHQPSADGSKVYANIASLAPLRKSDKQIRPEGKTTVFSFADGQLPGAEIPEWLRKQMAESEEYKAMTGAKPAHEEPAPPPYDDNDMPPFVAPNGQDELPF